LLLVEALFELEWKIMASDSLPPPIAIRSQKEVRATCMVVVPRWVVLAAVPHVGHAAHDADEVKPPC